MPKSIELRILERQLKLAELELARLVVATTPMVNELEVTDAFTHQPFHEGPDYLEVRSDMWNNLLETDYGRVKTLEEARSIAKKKGYKGISCRAFKKGEKRRES